MKLPKITPLMNECIRKTDSNEVIQLALLEAKRHPFYIGQPMGGVARFSTYVTLKERNELIKSGSKSAFIKVAANSVHNTFRFANALEYARKKIRGKHRKAA